MTERPIPFSAEMVRAILRGEKTQTRRQVKLDQYGAVKRTDFFPNDLRVRQFCPYGQPGDLLWVREAWRAPSQYDDRPPSRIPPGVEVQYIADDRAPWISRYRSPRFMPRWASRLKLRITDVRVERLQDISEDDARAEGVGYKTPGYLPGTKGNWIGSFAYLWNHLNGPGAWEANPWVWAISFERADP